jgi:hypothetical protein
MDRAWQSFVHDFPSGQLKIDMTSYFHDILNPLIKTGEFWKLPFKGEFLFRIGTTDFYSQTDMAYPAAAAAKDGNWESLAKIFIQVIMDRYSAYDVEDYFKTNNMTWKSYQDILSEMKEQSKKETEAKAKADGYVIFYVRNGVPTRQDPYNPDNYILFNHTAGTVGWSDQSGYTVRDKGMPELRKNLAITLKAGAGNIPAELLSQHSVSAGSSVSAWEEKINVYVQQMETTQKLAQTYTGYARGGREAILAAMERRDWEELAEAVLWSWTVQYGDYLKKVEDDRKKQEEKPEEPEQPKEEEPKTGTEIIPVVEETGLPGWMLGGGIAAGALVIAVVAFIAIRRKRK